MDRARRRRAGALRRHRAQELRREPLGRHPGRGARHRAGLQGRAQGGDGDAARRRARGHRRAQGRTDPRAEEDPMADLRARAPALERRRRDLRALRA
ncbi:hypothetical protein D7W79_14615 [Corallococcus exercitus]|nr:hypothetical protein D7W79_14615 [Corallococcus exercitus]